MRFEKYEGLGNDFLVVDEPEARLGPEDARRLCDRHRGVGGDGVLLTGLRGGRPFMKVLNADGSVPQMCGNGVRCVALHLFATERVGREPFELDTDAGPHRVRVHEGGREGSVEVWMVAPSLTPADLPLDADHPWVGEPIEVAGHRIAVTAVSMGNPHAVVFDAGEAREVLGPALEVDPRFPERVNAGFASGAGEGLALRVWERGVGWTQACGTGACAAAVAAVETGRATRGTDLPVTLPGGTLTIRVGAPGERVRMTGPARRVFSGTV
ncbi:MAG TPA: diaminopimelate epimerase [Sandaracinaceae bacterium LLY-WYZ-13_1]|nr:diaminopimelate epimerase [Sandaracinaceae bacterium LLY-WYZ-13_1]